MVFLIVLAILFVIGIVIYVKWFKPIRMGNMICVTGGIKTGKSLLCVRQAKQLIFHQRVKVFLFNHLFRYLAYPFYGFRTNWKLKAKLPRPLLYSNIPLNVPYIPVTKELLERKEKPVQGSVCYICEASLVADSMTFQDKILNEELLLFNKLWGHASKGGYLIYDTQSIADNHYAVKRCLNSYIYIHHMVKIPFFCLMWLREDRYSDDKNGAQSVYTEDVEEKLLFHIVPKSTFYLYDRYCYSVLTDDKPYQDKEKKKPNSLKATFIVSFKNYLTLKKDGEKK